MVSPIANSPCTPPRPSANSPAETIDKSVETALSMALPGVNIKALLQNLKVLLGGRNYALIGSASMHLHAMNQPNLTCGPLPEANDLDVLTSPQAVDMLQFESAEVFEKLNFRRDPDHAHVLYFKQGDTRELKIDLVKTDNTLFKNSCNTVDICGLSVRSLSDSMAAYKARENDADLTEDKGQDIKEKIQYWLKYFPEYSQANSHATQATSALSLSTRSLKRQASGSPDNQSPSQATTQHKPRSRQKDEIPKIDFNN